MALASTIIFGTLFWPISQQEIVLTLIYWLTGDQLFFDFPSDICSPSSALDLLGSTVWGSNDIYDSDFVTKVDQTLFLHSLLSCLEDPQCELLQKCSYSNSCKIPHLLHMVPLMKAWTNYKYLMTGYVKPLREYYVSLCLKDPGSIPLYLMI